MKNYSNNSGCFGKKTGLFFGLLVALAGTLLLAMNLGWLDAQLRHIVFSWPMIFVFFTVVSLINRNLLSALVFLGLSTFFLLPRIAGAYPNAIPWIDSGFAATYWPALLIFMGICIAVGLHLGKGSFILIFNGQKGSIFSTSEGVTGKDGIYRRAVVFGGAEDVFLEPVFRGGEVSAVFGGVELDLRKTTLPEGDTHLDVSVVFGGLELILPKEWKVINEVGAAFGGVEDSRKTQHTIEVDESRRLIIRGAVVFGGMEIV